MAGAGYKLFNTGDVLTAAQVNTYLQEQAVMVFADASARTTALSGVLAEGMITYLKSDDKVYKYTGAAWVEVGGGSSPLTTKGDLYTYSTADARLAVGTNGQYLKADSTAATGLSWATLPASGKVLQVVSATTTTATTIATDTLTDTGISASITPSSASSKVLVLITAEFKHFRNGAGFTGIATELLRGSTTIADWNKTDADEFDFIQYAGSSANVYKSGTTSVIYLDSPATTSSTTYKLQARGYDSSVSVTFQKNSAISTITLMEIGA